MSYKQWKRLNFEDEHQFSECDVDHAYSAGAADGLPEQLLPDRAEEPARRGRAQARGSAPRAGRDGGLQQGG